MPRTASSWVSTPRDDHQPGAEQGDDRAVDPLGDDQEIGSGEDRYRHPCRAQAEDDGRGVRQLIHSGCGDPGARRCAVIRDGGVCVEAPIVSAARNRSAPGFGGEGLVGGTTKSREIRAPRVGGRARLQQFRRPHRSRRDEEGRPQGARSRASPFSTRRTPMATRAAAPRRASAQILGDRRKDIVLATKFARPMDAAGRLQGASRRYIMAEVEASLRRLKTDWIDLYQQHQPDPLTPIEETLRALDDLVRQGKVRYIGCSTLPAWQVVEAQWTSKHLGLHHFISCQEEYSLLARDLDREMMPVLEAYGLGLIPFRPLADGLLTGKYRRGAPPPAGTRLATMARAAERNLTDENWARRRAARGFCRRARPHSAGARLELAARRPAVASVIAGATEAGTGRRECPRGELALDAGGDARNRPADGRKMNRTPSSAKAAEPSGEYSTVAQAPLSRGTLPTNRGGSRWKFGLDGKSAVVTGGSKGLGLAIAEEYAKSGADVAILARDQGTLAEAKAKIQAGAPGRKVAAISCDVSKAADIRRAYDQIMSEFGKIDIYVNNAGQSTRGPSEDDHRRDVAGRSRPQIVRADPLLPPRFPADEAAALGSHHQRAQHRRQGAGRGQRADLGQPCRADGVHEGVVAGGCAAQRAGQFAACRRHRQRPDRAPPPARGRQRLARGFHPRRPGRACRWAAWAAPRNSPMSPASSPPTRPPM